MKTNEELVTDLLGIVERCESGADFYYAGLYSSIIALKVVRNDSPQVTEHLELAIKAIEQVLEVSKKYSRVLL